jgi:SAM-dependent methyltransferase
MNKSPLKIYSRIIAKIKQLFIPITTVNLPSFKPNICKFLQSKAEVDEATAFLPSYGFFSHPTDAKNWDLAHIIPEIGDGNILDMGGCNSIILKNVALRKIRGQFYEIDLQGTEHPIKGIKHIVGDLMDTKLPDKFFKSITCISVTEHGVDFAKFAHEVARLLEDKGKLFVSFDYWNPKIISPIKLFGLDWQPLDEEAVKTLIAECEKEGLYLIEDMDYKTDEKVICDGYHSPHPAMSYTFGLAVFEKR